GIRPAVLRLRPDRPSACERPEVPPGWRTALRAPAVRGEVRRILEAAPAGPTRAGQRRTARGRADEGYEDGDVGGGEAAGVPHAAEGVRARWPRPRDRVRGPIPRPRAGTLQGGAHPKDRGGPGRGSLLHHKCSAPFRRPRPVGGWGLRVRGKG